MGEPQPTYEHPPVLTTDQRAAHLDRAIAEWMLYNARIESRTPTTVALVQGHSPNHTVHAILTVCSCGFWAIIWAIAAATQTQKRTVLTVDEYGYIHRL